MKRFFKKQTKLWATILSLVLVLGIGSTLAYLQATTGVLTNVFSPAHLDTKIEEVLDTDGTKQVQVTNIGKSDAYVRARIMVSGIDPDKIKISTDTKGTADKDEIVLVMQNTNSDAWHQVSGKTAKDDWYYYGVVLPGTRNEPTNSEARKTEPLLQKVVFGSEVDVSAVQITIMHESVLASGFTSAEEAFAAQG